MNVSSVKNLNGETFSAVQDADLTTVVQANSATWGAGSTPTYDYTDNNLISAIDTSGLYATSANVATYANSVVDGGRLGHEVYYISDYTSQVYHKMVLNPKKTPFWNTSGIYGPLKYAQDACMTYGSSAYGYQYFGGFIKGNEWYVSNATAGQALRGETHYSRGVHISGVTTAGLSFDLSVNCISGKNDTNNYNWKLERGCVSGKGVGGEWRYGPAEDTLLRSVSSNEVNTYVQNNSATIDDVNTTYQTNSSTYLTAVDLTPYATTAEVESISSMLSGAIDYVSANAGDEFPASADEAIQYVQTNSGTIDDTVTSYQTNSGTFLTAHQAISAEEWNSNYETVNTNSGAWGGSALPISAGPGIKFEMVDGTLVASTDETVLFENWESPIRGTTATGSLTEPLTSFDSFEVTWAAYGNRGEARWEPVTQKFPSYPSNSASYYTLFAPWLVEEDAGTYLFMELLSANDTNFCIKEGRFYQYTTTVTGKTTDMANTKIYKIVGINRKQ